MPRGGPGKPRKKEDPRVRFFSFVQKDENGCWLWTGFRWKSGYANFWAGGRSWRAHVWAYINLRNKTVPKGFHVDHQCNQPACVNPWHMKAMSPRDNVLRSETAPTAINARKVECIRGHTLDGENLYTTPEGRRQCRSCRDAATRRYQMKMPEHATVQ